VNTILTLAAGANQPLDGATVTIDVTAADLAGACLAVEEPQGVRILAPADAMARVTVFNSRASLEITLSAVPAHVARLRLLVWSQGKTRTLVPATARVAIDGSPRFDITVDARLLRAAEVLEIYRRTGMWKVRAVASGWTDHIPAMARAVGVPETAFQQPGLAPTAAPPPPTSGPRRRTAPIRRGPSPQVGPPPLRDLLDSIIGPGPRTGDDTFLDFQLNDVSLRLAYQNRDGLVQVAALAPLGTGHLTDATAELALRVTGEAPLARVTINDEGAALASAMAFLAPHNLDSGLLKALLSEAWTAAHRFAERARPIGWSTTDALVEQVPREFRLGVVEDLQDQTVWAELRDRLIANDCLPLADEPAALLALTGDGQLCIGPTILAGTPRAWAVVVERVLRSDVTPRAGLWRAIAMRNHPLSPIRLGVIEEVGVRGPLAITVNYTALQLPRTQVMEDLQHGLNFVDDAASEFEPMMRNMAADAVAKRNNVPWIPTRTWAGPGSELRGQTLVRDVAGVPLGGGVPTGLVARVREQQAALGRPGTGLLGHLALLRAERGDAASAAWKHVAREFVAMTPVVGPGEPCAAGSLHVRLARLDAPPPKPRRPVPPDAQLSRPQQPAPARIPAPPAPDVPPRRKRWRLFG
jgi:TerD domain